MWGHISRHAWRGRGGRRGVPGRRGCLAGRGIHEVVGRRCSQEAGLCFEWRVDEWEQEAR